MIVEKKKYFILIGVLLLVVAGIIAFFVIKPKKNKAKIEKVHFSNSQAEINNKTYEIGDYTVALKKSIYSKKGRIGKLLFEVTKKDGKPEIKKIAGDGRISSFGAGDNWMMITMSASGTISSTASYEGDKLKIFTEFSMNAPDESNPDEVEAIENYPIYIYCKNDEDSDDGKYGFKLEENSDEKEIKLLGSQRLVYSPLGLTIYSDARIGRALVEFENAKGKKKVAMDVEKESSDIAGFFGSGCGTGAGYTYQYTFKNLYDVSKIKKVYVNGKCVG
ncbi:MAG: hypothetical protein K6G62_03780 [Eubacterium sp.]|nr:hypothetical protein [Eubacterium sp.]